MNSIKKISQDSKIKNIAIFGGSFDPFHQGHLEVITQALKLDFIDLLIILPNFLNPLKNPPLFSPQTRIQLIKEKTKYLNRILISDFELHKKSFSIDSILHFKALYNPQKIYFIIGADILNELPKWHKINDIHNEVTFIIATRDDIFIPTHYLKLQIKENISSTFVREHINDYFINFDIESALQQKMKDEIKNIPQI